MAEMLLRLNRKWKLEHRGVSLGSFLGSREAFQEWSTKVLERIWYYDPEDVHVGGLGFLDDIITLATSMNDTNHMFEDIWRELRQICLEPLPKKLLVMPNQWVRDAGCREGCDGALGG